MNKYDDIKTLLFTNMDIRQSCEFLLNYLKNYCFKPYNKDKIDSYYTNLAEILKKLLYFPNEANTNPNPPNPKLFQSFLQVLNGKNSNFEDLDIILNLFLVPSNLENEMNIFSSIFIHNFGSTKFLFPITNSSNSNIMVLNYLDQNKIDTILNAFGIFHILSQPRDDLIKYLAKKELVLTIREYYIFIILNFIKKSSNIIKINIKDFYPNFKKFLENINESKFYSKKTEFIVNNFEKDRSITYNFYNILFLDFILFLHFSNNIQNYRLLEILTFATQLLWLGDYQLIPQANFFPDYNLNRLPNKFTPQAFGNPNARNFNSPSKIPNYYSSGNYVLSDHYLNSLNLSIPNLLVLKCLKNLITLLQSKRYLFDEIVVKEEKLTILKSNSLLFNLQNSLFNLFKYGFALNFQSQNKNTEVSLSDFASVWYTFITPWESFFNDSESHNLNANEKSFGFFSWGFSAENNSKNFNPGFYNCFKKNTSPLKTIFTAHSNLLKNKALISDYLPYIEINIQFYTDLFQDYLNAFCACNVFSIEELSMLINTLEMFELNHNGHFICDLINYPKLRDFSNETINGISQSGFIENLISNKPYMRKFIFPFDITENTNQIKKLISSLLNLIFKLSNSNDYRIEDTTRFIKKIEHSIGILKNLYRISEDDIQYKEALTPPIRNSANVYDKRIILESLEFDNPWNKKITSEESSFLYFILINIAYFIDFVRKIPRKYTNNNVLLPPVTNLRYLCNYYNLISTFGILLAFYFMIKLIILYLH